MEKMNYNLMYNVMEGNLDVEMGHLLSFYISKILRCLVLFSSEMYLFEWRFTSFIFFVCIYETNNWKKTEYI